MEPLIRSIKEHDIKQHIHDEEEILCRIEHRLRASVQETAHQMHTHHFTNGKPYMRKACTHTSVDMCLVLHAKGYIVSVDFYWMVEKSCPIKHTFFDEAQFIQNGLTNCQNTHIWSSDILHLSTFLSFSVNMLCCLISSHIIQLTFPTRRATTHL